MKNRDYIIGIAIVLLDQIVKHFMINKYITIIPNLLYFKYTQNTGAAFGIGTINVVTVVSILIILGIIMFIIKEKNSITNFIPYILIISGSIGNLTDRLLRGYVIDYIKVDVFSFPCFNIADICITFGVILLIIGLCIRTTKSQNQSKI